MVTARLRRGFRCALARAALLLGILLALPCACASSKDDFNDPSGSGESGGTGGTASGTLGTLLARCNGLCDDAASAKCGNDTQGCHTLCSNSLDEFQHCTDEYDAVLDCGEALIRICALYDPRTADSTCSSELGDYTHCIKVYCDANPGDAICK